MIGFVTKAMFFDKAAVIGAVDKATRKVLSKFGAFVRTGARHSLRKRKSTSDPGEPPSSHTGLLKKFILFGYDREHRSVVIGPMRLNQKIGDADLWRRLFAEAGFTLVEERIFNLVGHGYFVLQP